MIDLYVLPSSSSSRQAKRFLDENDIPYNMRNIAQRPLRHHEFRRIIEQTENGVDDILSVSKRIPEIESETKPLADYTLNEFFALAQVEPRILKAPILVTHNRIIVGYQPDAYETLVPRSKRKRGYYDMLRRVQEEEDAALSSMDDEWFN